MKLSVMQENLARGLSVVSRAVSTRSTLPVLANVLLKTEDAGLKLTATNLEIGITYWVPGKIETDGAMTVPARLLTDLVGSLPASERVDLELKDNDTLQRLISERYVAFKYVDENGKEGPYPINPNGSVASIAGLTDSTGRILGLMPHPERYIRRTQHPHWSRLGQDLDPDGIKIFRNAVRYVKDNQLQPCPA